MKIRVCIPFYNEFEAIKPLLQDLEKSKEHEFIIEPRQGCNLTFLRNSFITDGTTDILDLDAWLFIDSDLILTIEDIYKLINHGKDVISAPYLMQGGRGAYCCGEIKPGSSELSFRYSEQNRPQGLKQISYITDGLLFVKREVFELYRKEFNTLSFFRSAPYRDGTTGLEVYPNRDFGFCYYLRQLSVSLWCDFDIRVGHIMRDSTQINWDIHKVNKGFFQTNKKEVNTMKIELTDEDLTVIIKAVENIPYKIAMPILAKISIQVKADRAGGLKPELTSPAKDPEALSVKS
jgi:hypothetical protein